MTIKRELFSVLFLITSIFLASLVSSACASSDVILKLSSTTNAHMENAAGTTYTNEVCYSTVFGSTYSGSNPQSCTGTNTVLKLSSTTNAHGEIATGNAYSTSICYGDLVCYADTSTSSLTTCNDGISKVVMRLSGSTNAHGELASFSPANYATKICCASAGNPVWKDSSGNTVSTIRLGSSVYATLPNYNGNPDNTFDIYEKDSSSSDTIKSNVAGSASGSNFRYSWTPSSTDMSTAGGPSDKTGGNPFQFYFNINNKQSGYLDVRYCGDGISDPADGETCDAGSNNGQTCTPSYGTSNCQYCDSNCQTQIVGFPYCGDGVINGEETCDDGSSNGACTPGPSGSCNYCDATTCTTKVYNIADLIWADTLGNPITTADVGDTVLLIYPNVESTFTSTFNVWEDDGLLGKTTIRDVTNGAVLGSDYIGYWTITPSEYALGDDGAIADLIDQSKTEFGFSIDGKDVKSTNYLDIKPNSGSGNPSSSDDPLLVSFTNLKCGDEFQLSGGTYPLDIKFKVADKDDLVAYVLKINGEAVAGDTDSNLDSFGFSGEFTYSKVFDTTSSGTVNLRLEAKNTKGQLVTEVANIIVINPAVSGTYLAACIKEPKNYEHIGSDFAKFDARDSKAVTYDSSSSITTRSTSSELKYFWTFSDDTANPFGTKASTDERAYLFMKYFPQKGGNSADLRVEL